MKKAQNFIKRTIDGEVLLVPLGELAQKLNGLISLHGVAEYIWDHVEETASFEDLVDKLQAEYDVDPQELVRDTEAFVNQMIYLGLLVPDTKQW